MVQFIPAGIKWAIPFRPEWIEPFHSGQNEMGHSISDGMKWSITFQLEWNGPFNSSWNEMVHSTPAGMKLSILLRPEMTYLLQPKWDGPFILGVWKGLFHFWSELIHCGLEGNGSFHSGWSILDHFIRAGMKWPCHLGFICSLLSSDFLVDFTVS